MKARCRDDAGLKLGLICDGTARPRDILPIASLYSDLSIVFSGYDRESLVNPESLAKGGIYLHDIPLWLHDLLNLWPGILDGSVISLPRNYFNAYPNQHRTAWVLEDWAGPVWSETRGREQLHELAVYSSLLRPKQYGVIPSAANVDLWRDRVLCECPSIQQAGYYTLLNLKLPFLMGGDQSAVFGIRRDYAPSLRAFRQAVNNYVVQARAQGGDRGTLERAAKHLQSDIIEPSLVRIEEDLRRESLRKWAVRAGVALAYGSFFLSIYEGSTILTSAAAAGVAGVETLKAIAEGGSPPSEENDFYVLWKLQKSFEA